MEYSPHTSLHYEHVPEYTCAIWYLLELLTDMQKIEALWLLQVHGFQIVLHV